MAQNGTGSHTTGHNPMWGQLIYKWSFNGTIQYPVFFIPFIFNVLLMYCILKYYRNNNLITTHLKLCLKNEEFTILLFLLSCQKKKLRSQETKAHT